MMDWGSLIGPAVVAAGVSGFISIVSMVVTTRSARQLHSEKLASDRDLAERKFEFDKDLAERKFRYDRDLHSLKRQIELVEEVLVCFYQVRDVFESARFPGSFSDEGKERPRDPNETEDEARIKDAYYVPIARLNENIELFSKLHSYRHRFEAYFGPEAASAFAEIHRVRVEIFSAAEILIMDYRERKPDPDPEFTKQQKEIIWKRHSKADPLEERVSKAIEKVEQVCRPFLSGVPSA
jgi:hypothetical protein